MSNTDFILRLDDGVTAIDLTPSFDTKIAKELVLSEARSKAGSLFRYKWAEFMSYDFDLEHVSAYNAAILNDWHSNVTSLSMSLGTALDIDAAFYFPLDESSGDLCYDLVNSLCLTFSGYNPDIVTGLFGGKAREFDAGSSCRGFSTTAINSLTSGCDFWNSTLFKVSGATSGTLLSTYTHNSSTDGSGWALRINTDSGFIFDSAVQSAGPARANIYGAIAANHNYQLVFANSGGTIAFWLKDHSVNTLSYLGVTSATIQYYQSSTFLTVGQYGFDSASYFLPGGIVDDIRGGIHSLSQADIEFLTTARMFNPGLPIKQSVVIMDDKSPFDEFQKPYITEYKGTLKLEEI